MADPSQPSSDDNRASHPSTTRRAFFRQMLLGGLNRAEKASEGTLQRIQQAYQNAQAKTGRITSKPIQDNPQSVPAPAAEAVPLDATQQAPHELTENEPLYPPDPDDDSEMPDPASDMAEDSQPESSPKPKPDPSMPRMSIPSPSTASPSGPNDASASGSAASTPPVPSATFRPPTGPPPGVMPRGK